MEKKEIWLHDIGARIKVEREKQGLTQQALAAKANTKQDYIAQLERGSRNPSLRTFMNLLSGLDISADYLIYGANKDCSNGKNELLGDFMRFMSRRNEKDIADYFRLVRFLSEFVDSKNY